MSWSAKGMAHSAKDSGHPYSEQPEDTRLRNVEWEKEGHADTGTRRQRDGGQRGPERGKRKDGSKLPRGRARLDSQISLAFPRHED